LENPVRIKVKTGVNYCIFSTILMMITSKNLAIMWQEIGPTVK